jgi:hypothetical protein
VLIDGSGGIIAGHGRVEAAKLLGMADIPAVCAGHLTPAQIRAYVIADNRLAELTGWDRKLLALEVQELSVELDFDVAITGFETTEVDLLIGELGKETPDEADVVPGTDWTRPAISQPGELKIITCSAATPWIQKATNACSAARKLNSFLPTRPITSLLRPGQEQTWRLRDGVRRNE